MDERADVLVATRGLGALTRAQLQAALDRFGLGTLVGAEAATGGNWGQNCFVTSAAGEFVLRGAPFYPWQLLEEQFFARLLHERTAAPTPWPYLVEQSPALFGWPYAVMGRLRGEQVTAAVRRGAIGRADRLSLARQLGAVLAETQDVTWPVAGPYHPTTGGIQASAAHNPGMEALESYALPKALDTAAYVREFLERVRRAAPARTTAADEAWVEEVLARGAAALREPFTPRCVLPDYQENNAAAARAPDGTWRVSGVFDLMGACFGDGEKALCRQLPGYLAVDPALAVAYVRAYFERRPPRAGVRERLAVYVLADALGLWEWALRTGRVRDESLTLRDSAGIDALDRVLPEALAGV
jgi:hypothetical protein